MKAILTQQQALESNFLKRVIVVEGDPSLRMNIVNYLTSEGYTVTEAGSAYEFYQHVFLEPNTVAIIDTDLSDQNGQVVAEYARKNTAMRVITLSSPLSTNTLPTNIKAGGDLNFVKPVNCRILASCVANLFSRLASA